MDQLNKIGGWIIGLLMIGGFLLRLFDGPSYHYNRRYIYGITPKFIYWAILVSSVRSTVVAWYLDVRRWKIALKRKLMWSVGLSMLPTVIFTLFFGWFMWSCDDDPRYREARVLEVLDKSAYKIYVGGEVPTPPIISHCVYRVFIVTSSLRRRLCAGLGDVGALVFATYQRSTP